MKIVIPTNDEKLVEKKTGHAKYFAVYEAKDGTVNPLQLLENNHEHHSELHNEHSHDEQAKQFAGFDVFIVQHLGSHFKSSLINTGINIFFTKKESINEAIQEYLQSVKEL